MALLADSLQQLACAGSVDHGVALRICDLQENNGKIKCTFSDGGGKMAGLITSQVGCCQRRTEKTTP